MAKVEKISISLTGELADVVRGAVNSGRYASTSEVIRAAIRDFSELEAHRGARLAELRGLIQEGLDSGIAPGRRTADEIIAEGRRRLEALKAKA
ncbi:type II toxin-antitoxin system ParD family antitoxin [Phenylobacterium conjunctum]|jgi:antitoxin ParD1/3/4|uniref:Type II toxin-antitoxin system ParD family antitoxin n=1 Tax=Phenylobacterium conjunctum TaxID=1298959 RepID=A0ABW3T620_9CAUL